MKWQQTGSKKPIELVVQQLSNFINIYCCIINFDRFKNHYWSRISQTWTLKVFLDSQDLLEALVGHHGLHLHRALQHLHCSLNPFPTPSSSPINTHIHIPHIYLWKRYISNKPNWHQPGFCAMLFTRWDKLILIFCCVTVLKRQKPAAWMPTCGMSISPRPFPCHPDILIPRMDALLGPSDKKGLIRSLTTGISCFAHFSSSLTDSTQM